MAVNQPPIKEDLIESSWDLEVTNQINSEEARVNALLARVQVLESMMGMSSGPETVSSVDETGILRLTNGRLSNVPVGAAGALQINNYVQMIQENQLEYNFVQGSVNPGNLSVVPHQVFVGGQKLVESIDYTPSSTLDGQIMLLRQPNLTEPLTIELTVWSL